MQIFLLQVQNYYNLEHPCVICWNKIVKLFQRCVFFFNCIDEYGYGDHRGALDEGWFIIDEEYVTIVGKKFKIFQRKKICSAPICNFFYLEKLVFEVWWSNLVPKIEKNDPQENRHQEIVSRTRRYNVKCQWFFIIWNFNRRRMYAKDKGWMIEQ